MPRGKNCCESIFATHGGHIEASHIEASHIEASQPHFPHFPRFRVRISRVLLRGTPSDPYFSGVRGTFRIFRAFPLSGSNH